MLLAGGAVAGFVVWTAADPSGVVVGTEGQHDAAGGATCLDCHVPFVGTPASRCLSPGCHGALATGTPPRDGPAMPIRFHAALRRTPCQTCHAEHGTTARAPAPRFDHAVIPPTSGARCRACHLAETVRAHARTDAVACDVCHGLSSWSVADMNHDAVREQPCDLCHPGPTTDSHAAVAGTCTDCHGVEDWTPQVDEK